MSDWELWPVAAVWYYIKNVILHIASLGNDQNSKSKIHFLLNAYCFFAIIKLKNHKWNHCELGTVYTIHFLFCITRESEIQEGDNGREGWAQRMK
jgi:hypothetical protein